MAKHQTPDIRSTNHAGYVKYLYECAERWSKSQAFKPAEKIANQEQANRVLAKAKEWEALTPETCPICLAPERS